MRTTVLALALAVAACNQVFGLEPVGRDDAGAPADASVAADADPDATATVDGRPLVDAGSVDAGIVDAAIDARAPVCGDGLAEGTEVCDDGNAVTESECPYGSPTCRTCNFNCTGEVILTGPFCGDGTVQAPPEECEVLGPPSCCQLCMLIPC